MDYVGIVIRPPSEAYSMIIQVSVACSHGRCTFCSSDKGNSFFIKDINTIIRDINEASEYSGLTHDFLRQLASKGKLRARKFGQNWLTTRSAVDKYLQSRSPVGRKPKSQKDI